MGIRGIDDTPVVNAAIDGFNTILGSNPQGSSATVAARFESLAVVSDGTANDQSARINAALAAAPASNKLVRLVGDFTIRSPLIVYSGTTLDARQAIIRVPTGVQINAVQNAAYVVTARGVVDGAMTSGSATLTSATAAFTSSDVGAAVRVQGAGASGADLDTTIISVSSATTAVLAASAATTTQASGAYVGIGPRDSDITVIGGYWDRNATYGADNNDRHALLFHRVDRLTIRDATVKVTNGKYAVLASDVTDTVISGIRLDATASDGVHINGPARRVQVSDISGRSGDDMVALITADGSDVPAYMTTKGSIVGVSITNVHGRSSTTLVKVQGNADHSGGTDHISIRNVVVDEALTGNNNAIRISSGPSTNGAHGRLTIRDVHGTVNVNDGANDGGTIDRLSIQGLSSPQLSNNIRAVNIKGPTTIKTMTVSEARARMTATANALVAIDGSATISQLGISDVDWGSGTGTNIVQLVNAANAVTDLVLRNIVLENTANTGGLVGTTAGCTLTRVGLHNCDVRAGGNAISFSCSSTLTINGLRTNSTGINVNSGYTVTVYGGGMEIGSNNTSTGTLRLFCLDFRIDVSSAGVATNQRGLAYNTNAGLACGLGPVVCDAAGHWRSLYTGVST